MVERRRATIAPGVRLPVLLKFCALRSAAASLTVSAVKWTVLQHASDGGGGIEAAVKGAGGARVWVAHRLEGKGALLHSTLEQRAARYMRRAYGGSEEGGGECRGLSFEKCLLWVGLVCVLYVDGFVQHFELFTSVHSCA